MWANFISHCDHREQYFTMCVSTLFHIRQRRIFHLKKLANLCYYIFRKAVLLWQIPNSGIKQITDILRFSEQRRKAAFGDFRLFPLRLVVLRIILVRICRSCLASTGFSDKKATKFIFPIDKVRPRVYTVCKLLKKYYQERNKL